MTCSSFSQPLQGEWNSFNRAELERLLTSSGKASPSYDSTRPPYAVFDWDNTSIFLDAEEATLAYQLDNFIFSATPTDFKKALEHGLPEDQELKDLLADIVDSYSWLYLRSRLGAEAKQLRAKPHHHNLRAKGLYLYYRLEEKYGPDVAYPWMPYRFAGMTAEQVRQVTHQAISRQLKEPIETVEWKSPAQLSGRAGVVTVSWKSGVRLLPEMQQLYHALREAGFDVWICTASFVEGIRELSSSESFGYDNPEERVLGLELETDDRGRYRPERLSGSEITYKKGKTDAIQRHLVARYGYGPTFIAGDSDGDANMAVDFSETKLTLLIDTGTPRNSAIAELTRQARAQRGQTGARFLLQERDERNGRFRP